MRIKFSHIPILIFFAGCSFFLVNEDKQAERSRQESERLHQFFDEYFNNLIERSPGFATRLGLKDNYHLLTDNSERRALDNHRWNQQYLRRLKRFNYNLLSEVDRLSFNLLHDSLQNSIDAFAFRYHFFAVNHRWGIHTNLPSFMMNMHRIDDLDDAKAYLSRLRQFPEQFENTIIRLEASRRLGIIPPQFVFPYVYEAATNVITGAPFDKSLNPSPLYEDFTRKIERISISEDVAQGLIDELSLILLTKVAPSYEALISKMKELEPHAPKEGGAIHLPRGREFYRERLSSMTTTSLTPGEIHQIGLDETKRIHAEMKEILTQINFEGSLQDFFDHIRTSPKYRYPDTIEGREQYIIDTQKLIDRMYDFLPEIFGILPKAPLEVRPVEPYRERSAGLAFYQRPSADGSRPGVYYINLYNMDDADKVQQEALAYHEAVPGHHMQIAIATELENVPEFRKYLRYTAYTEGWGLYAEYIPYLYGFYQDPISNFGRLSMELRRAGRLVIDTALHAKGWTMEQALEWLNENTPSTESDNISSIQRFIVNPAQATAYLIGRNKIIELKHKAQKKLGERFDIRSFHDEILRDGAVPLFVLEQKIDHWIESQSAN